MVHWVLDRALYRRALGASAWWGSNCQPGVALYDLYIAYTLMTLTYSDYQTLRTLKSVIICHAFRSTEIRGNPAGNVRD